MHSQSSLPTEPNPPEARLPVRRNQRRARCSCLWVFAGSGLVAIALSATTYFHSFAPLQRQWRLCKAIEEQGGIVYPHGVTARGPLQLWLGSCWRGGLDGEVQSIGLSASSNHAEVLRLAAELSFDGIVYFEGSGVSDAALAGLPGITSLQCVDLSGTSVTDAGLVLVGRLTTLVYLDLSDTQITDAGLAYLRDLKSLQFLALRNTRVTDAGVVPLVDQAILEHLQLDRAFVSDAVLIHIANCSTLQELSLAGTNVTDEGLSQLQCSKSLTHVNLQGTHVSPEGVARFSARLPYCRVLTESVQSDPSSP